MINIDSGSSSSPWELTWSNIQIELNLDPFPSLLEVQVMRLPINHSLRLRSWTSIVSRRPGFCGLYFLLQRGYLPAAQRSHQHAPQERTTVIVMHVKTI